MKARAGPGTEFPLGAPPSCPPPQGRAAAESGTCARGAEPRACSCPGQGRDPRPSGWGQNPLNAPSLPHRPRRSHTPSPGLEAGTARREQISRRPVRPSALSPAWALPGWGLSPRPGSPPAVRGKHGAHCTADAGRAECLPCPLLAVPTACGPAPSRAQLLSLSVPPPVKPLHPCRRGGPVPSAGEESEGPGGGTGRCGSRGPVPWPRCEDAPGDRALGTEPWTHSSPQASPSTCGTAIARHGRRLPRPPPARGAAAAVRHGAGSGSWLRVRRTRAAPLDGVPSPADPATGPHLRELAPGDLGGPEVLDHDGGAHRPGAAGAGGVVQEVIVGLLACVQAPLPDLLVEAGVWGEGTRHPWSWGPERPGAPEAMGRQGRLPVGRPVPTAAAGEPWTAWCPRRSWPLQAWLS